MEAARATRSLPRELFHGRRRANGIDVLPVLEPVRIRLASPDAALHRAAALRPPHSATAGLHALAKPRPAPAKGVPRHIGEARRLPNSAHRNTTLFAPKQ